jgi:cysteine-rich repeat protein
VTLATWAQDARPAASTWDGRVLTTERRANAHVRFFFLMSLILSYLFGLSAYIRSLVAICGDGLILGSEECDDGRRPPSSGDGCSVSCKNETGWSCDYDPVGLKSNCTRMDLVCSFVFRRFNI